MGGEIIYPSLHCHHQNDSCIKMGSHESHFNVSVGRDGQSPRKPEGSLERTAQDAHLDSHTAPELWERSWQSSIYRSMNSTKSRQASIPRLGLRRAEFSRNSRGELKIKMLCNIYVCYDSLLAKASGQSTDGIKGT